jgi:hypothetical protein
MLMLLNIITSAMTYTANTTMTQMMSSINMFINSPATSPNVSHVSSPTLPTHPWSNCQLLLPHTVVTTLNTIGNDVDAITLCSICNGLLKTIKAHEATHQEVEDHLSKQICSLGGKIAEYQKTYDQEPDGYTENTCFSNLKLPIGAGFYLPTKWIKHLNNSDISCFSAHDDLCDALHIIPIYASPLSSNDTPTGPIPWWFHTIPTGPHAQFLYMVECACKFND